MEAIVIVTIIVVIRNYLFWLLITFLIGGSDTDGWLVDCWLDFSIEWLIAAAAAAAAAVTRQHQWLQPGMSIEANVDNDDDDDNYDDDVDDDNDDFDDARSQRNKKNWK